MKVCFPSNSFIVNQSAGVDKATNQMRFAYSHKGYKAIDINPLNQKLYAPCGLTCVYHQRVNVVSTNEKTAYLTVFKSDQEIECVDGTVGHLIIYCTHGALACQDAGISLFNGAHFNEGEVFYMEGKDNGLTSDGKQKELGSHVHFNAGIGTFNGSFATSIQGYYYLANEKFIEDIFYLTENGKVTFNSKNIDAYPFEFQYLDSQSFDPTGKSGWCNHNGTWYYVKDNECVKGWFKEGNSWYYLDYTTGAMQTGWAADGDKWYWLSPTSGVMQVDCWVDGNNYYVDSSGVMLTCGWKLIDDSWYYFKDKNRDTQDRFNSFAHGQKVTSTWIPDGPWYYLKADGKMAVSESLNINGVTYHFDGTGACLNP